MTWFATVVAVTVGLGWSITTILNQCIRHELLEMIKLRLHGCAIVVAEGLGILGRSSGWPLSLVAHLAVLGLSHIEDRPNVHLLTHELTGLSFIGEVPGVQQHLFQLGADRAQRELEVFSSSSCLADSINNVGQRIEVELCGSMQLFIDD